MINFFRQLHNKTILFKFGNYIFVTYGGFVGLAFFAGMSMALYYDSIRGINVDQIAGFYLLILLPAVFFGTRVLSVIEGILENKKFKYNARNIWRLIMAPGFNLQGGILIGGLAIAIYASINQLPFLAILDGAALASALGESIGRIGCHTFGCCWGKPTSKKFSIAYHNPDSKVLRLKPVLSCVKLHPVQIYSAFISFILFLFLFWLIPLVEHDGIIAGIYLILHGAIRVYLDKLRDDPRGILFKNFMLSTLSASLEAGLGILLCIIGISDTQTHVLIMDNSWWLIVTEPSIALKISIFALLAALYYGSHFYRVGTWIQVDEN